MRSAAPGLLAACSCTMTADLGRRIDELRAVEEQWNRALVANDPVAIDRYMAEEWVLIGPDGAIIPRDRFLAVIESGDLTHDAMDSDEWRVHVTGDTAVVTTRTRASGQYQGRPFETLERATSVYAREDGSWRCVLTQLTTLPE